MFGNDDMQKSLDAVTAGVMAFNPLVFWSVGAAIGLGALTGVGQALAERTARSSGLDFAAAPVRPKVRIKARLTGKPVAERSVLQNAPVEALSRPILNEMIEQAIAGKAAPAAKPKKPAAGKKPVAAKTKTGNRPARPTGLEKPRGGQADDLKRISGIGPKLEMTLNDLGIYHFDQIAAWAKPEIDWIDDYLSFKGRVARDRWIEQSKTLAL